MSLVHFLETIASSVDIDLFYSFFCFQRFLWICFYKELEQEPEFEALQGSSMLELDEIGVKPWSFVWFERLLRFTSIKDYQVQEAQWRVIDE